MLLVRCTHVENIIEKGIPCLALSACLLKFGRDIERESSGGEFKAILWHNQPIEELQSLPSNDKTIGLFAYPDANEPTLIISDWKKFYVWNGPVIFLFLIYDKEFVQLEMIDAVFSIKEM